MYLGLIQSHNTYVLPKLGTYCGQVQYSWQINPPVYGAISLDFTLL